MLYGYVRRWRPLFTPSPFTPISAFYSSRVPTLNPKLQISKFMPQSLKISKEFSKPQIGPKLSALGFILFRNSVHYGPKFGSGPFLIAILFGSHTNMKIEYPQALSIVLIGKKILWLCATANIPNPKFSRQFGLQHSPFCEILPLHYAPGSNGQDNYPKFGQDSGVLVS